MSDALEPAAACYTTIQPSAAGPFNAGSIKEGFICSGIWAVLATTLVVVLQWLVQRAHPEKALETEDWAHLIGVVVGQFLMMALALSSIVFYRRKANITSFILKDWRWWLACVIIVGLRKENVIPWFWVACIYQIRLSRNTKFRPSVATNP